MKVQQSFPVATWFVGCVVVSCLVHIAAPTAGIWGHLLTAITTGVIGTIGLAQHATPQIQRSFNPPQHHIHHHHQCGYDGGPGDDDGSGEWSEDTDWPRSPYPLPPSRN